MVFLLQKFSKIDLKERELFILDWRVCTVNYIPLILNAMECMECTDTNKGDWVANMTSETQNCV
jgi:hypothetical protein